MYRCMGVCECKSALLRRRGEPAWGREPFARRGGWVARCPMSLRGGGVGGWPWGHVHTKGVIGWGRWRGPKRPARIIEERMKTSF